MMMTRIREIACERILAQSIGDATTLFGRWIAGYWSVSDFGLVLKGLARRSRVCFFTGIM